ncbi:E3 ubiquitin-protein ligase RHA2A-like [Oryza brachyantha]|uniref:RING-type domain-containing protein n=1 Tax=Oryza brachyantha TaxID=4533 RepID=J3MP99_ORYBR|nr:E3 ubiquitin-protein ligase RHA2A-like [Oryza brachyantha]
MESAVLLLVVPALLAVAARSLAVLAWPVGSPSMRKLMARKKAARDELLRVARYSRTTGEGGGGESRDAECVVCLSGIEEGDDVRELRCRHLFHRACLDQWRRMAATCPLCRSSLLTSPAGDDDDEEETDSDMVLFMACVQSSSTWTWLWP